MSVQAAGEGGKRFEKSGNEEFATQLSQWNFAERGVLRAREVAHKQAGASEVNPPVYRIKDDVVSQPAVSPACCSHCCLHVAFAGVFCDH